MFQQFITFAETISLVIQPRLQKFEVGRAAHQAQFLGKRRAVQTCKQHPAETKRLYTVHARMNLTSPSFEKHSATK